MHLRGEHEAVVDLAAYFKVPGGALFGRYYLTLWWLRDLGYYQRPLVERPPRLWSAVDFP